MIPYKVVQCNNYDAIQQDLVSYINNFTTLISNDPRQNTGNKVKYPNFVDLKHFIDHNPKMIEWLKSLKLFPRDVYFTLTWYNIPDALTISPCPIHLDKPPVQWKMNFPILNMRPTSVRFFKPKDSSIDINELVTRTGDPDSKDNDNYALNYKDFEETHQHRFDKDEPIIMNGLIAHDVGVHGEVEYPRIGVQFMFIKEPTHLL